MIFNPGTRPFPGSFLKVIRAMHHRDELFFLLDNYGARLETTWVEVDGEPEKVKLTFSEPPPLEIPLIIGDAVHNLRSALDILVNDIGQKRNLNVDTARLQFPYALNESNYIRLIKKDFEKIGDDVQEALIALRAFEGGNETLCGLHNLDIRDKHRYVMPLMSCAWGKSANDLLQDDLAAMNISITYLTLGGGPSIMELPSLTPEGQISLKSVIGENNLGPYRANRAPTALFPESMPFARQHIVETLDKLIKTTQETYDFLENKFA